MQSQSFMLKTISFVTHYTLLSFFRPHITLLNGENSQKLYTKLNANILVQYGTMLSNALIGAKPVKCTKTICYDLYISFQLRLDH